jgi:hypothetical protein
MNRLGIAGLLLWVIGGCSDQPETIDTSGNHPTFRTTAPMTPEAKEAEVDTGRLVVLTPNSGYTVYTEDGHKVAHEENRGPAERRLAPGRYFVRLDQPSPDRYFWVTIEKGRVTQVENQIWSQTPPAVK